MSTCCQMWSLASCCFCGGSLGTRCKSAFGALILSSFMSYIYYENILLIKFLTLAHFLYCFSHIFLWSLKTLCSRCACHCLTCLMSCSQTGNLGISSARCRLCYIQLGLDFETWWYWHREYEFDCLCKNHTWFALEFLFTLFTTFTHFSLSIIAFDG